MFTSYNPCFSGPEAQVVSLALTTSLFIFRHITFGVRTCLDGTRLTDGLRVETQTRMFQALRVAAGRGEQQSNK